MWVKTEEKQYLNSETGTVLYVRSYHGVNKGVHGAELWRVMYEGRGQAPRTLRGGYESAEAAQDALDEFMSSQDVAEIQPPVTDEETADDTEEEV